MVVLSFFSCLMASPLPCDDVAPGRHRCRNIALPYSGAVSRLTAIATLHALRGGKPAASVGTARKLRTGKPWKRAEDYVPEVFGEIPRTAREKGVGIATHVSQTDGRRSTATVAGSKGKKQRPQASTESWHGTKAKRAETKESWYGTKAKRAEAKKKKWALRSEIDDENDSCEEKQINVRRLWDALAQLRAQVNLTQTSKHLLKENALKKKLHKEVCVYVCV